MNLKLLTNSLAMNTQKRRRPPKDLFILNRDHERMLTGNYNFPRLWANYGIFLIMFGVLLAFTLFVLLSNIDFDPSRLDITRFDWFGQGFIITIWYIIALIGVIIWIMSSLPPYLRLRRMHKNGQIIWGKIIHISGQKVYWSGTNKRGGTQSGSTYEVTVHCEFPNPHGRMIRATATHKRKDLKFSGPPKTGAVGILYVNDHDFMIL